MIVIINGAPGSGKSKTAQYLFLNTPQSAWVDGDTMLVINPQKRTDEELELRELNIASVAKNYYTQGFKIIFISFVYMSERYLTQQIELLKNIDEVKVFALVPNAEVLKSRHAKDDYMREGIDSSIEINSKISMLKNMEVIDNSNLTVEETGKQISRVLNL